MRWFEHFKWSIKYAHMDEFVLEPKSILRKFINYETL